MATRIVITYDDTHTYVHVTDDTGRNERATARRYPHPDSARYVKFVDALDVFMAVDNDKKACHHEECLTPWNDTECLKDKES
jgi:hypothetical protein